MSAIKERIFGAVTIMSKDDARRLWDLKMLKEIETDPDSHTFVSSADAMKELGL